MRRIISIILFIFCFTTSTFSGIVEVPGDQPTIQEGINAAQIGDTVLVAHGTYFENINFAGKAITVASKFILDQRKWHIRKTIIDGSQPADPNFGSVVSFVSGEDTNSVLCGFTITGGSGNAQQFPGFPPMRHGGGIFCSGSGAKIIHNIIIDNNIVSDGWTNGGRFYYGPPFVPNYIIIEDNIIKDNTITGLFQAKGGGIELACSGRIVNNIVTKNIAIAINEASAGGGISLDSWNPAELPPHVVIVTNNIISHNKALQNDDAEFWLGGIGGGISNLGSAGIISNNIIQYNEVSAANNSFAPGMLFDYPPDELYFRNNIVSHNYFSGSGPCFGGGFAVWDGSPTLENNLLEKNKATFGGGGWIGDTFSFTKVINNTIIKNHADEQGGAIYTKSAAPTVMNSILWNNHAPEGEEIFIESGTIDVTYSDVKGGWSGIGNIDRNPRLFGWMKFLRFRSPCIDAGNPDEMYNDPASNYFPNFAMLPARGKVRNDMGAYGGPYADDWWNFFNFRKEIESLETKDEQLASDLKSESIEVSQYPNPFNPSTNFEFQIPDLKIVSLKIFNVLGQEVATLVSEELNTGKYKYSWDASNFSSGVYIYQLQVGDYFESKKMTLLK
jgi:predicted outer membrane repeat protein